MERRESIVRLLCESVGQFEHYCSGAALAAGGSYLAAPTIGVGSVACGPSPALDRIVAFDRAETCSANISQTNMVRVSSFCGLTGLVLGIDVLPQPPVRFDSCSDSRVFRAEPLFEATSRLLGTIDEKRFPIAPGQHLLCAYKAQYGLGPCGLYGALAIAIPEDRSRDAALFLEDHGILTSCSGPNDVEQNIVESLLEGVRQVGCNLRVRYERVFVSVQTTFVPEGDIGCALTAVPYLNLAKRAVPKGDPTLLAQMSLDEWETEVAPQFLCNLQPERF